MLMVQHDERLVKRQWLGFVPFEVWTGFLENAQARRVGESVKIFVVRGC